MSHIKGLKKPTKVKMGKILLRSIPLTVRQDFKQACKERGTCMTHEILSHMIWYIRKHKKEKHVAARELARRRN